MLPSGNDAAYVLAENLGYIIKCVKKNQQHKIDNINLTNKLYNEKKD